ncbi:helix-turn-helix domain-containing protein [Pontibacter sp. G13]|uniref:helix-turn-helix domain-containing protein n=1 Tax=Pontibacter sp. G13 TaxID=3074898 RepID=UPI00288970E4|nr:helix-turn-helix domain-containing protein [Pontibacter sp. G13]WNJ18758.1 helix-turn-helix domain-containing protein [Pontibacter sp. G13]
MIKHFWLLAFGICLSCIAQAQVTIRVEQLPENTPIDARLYLSGDFNDWDPGNPDYAMVRQPDGVWEFTINTNLPIFGYKVTRGNWPSVEGRPNGRARPNRIVKTNPSDGPTIQSIKIASWEDLAGDPINGYTFFLLFSAFQGLLLIIALNGIQDNNKSSNRVLSVLLFLISFALVGRVTIYDREIFQWMPKLFLAPELILFLYSPVFYFYIQALLKFEEKLPIKPWIHFIPFGIHLLCYSPLLLMENQLFIDKVVEEEIHVYVAVAGAIAWFFNAYYLYRVHLILKNYDKASTSTQSSGNNLGYLNGVLLVNGICLVAWFSVYLIIGFSELFDLNVVTIREYATDAVWGVFAITTYVLGYYAMNQPEVFKLPKVVEKYKDSHLPDGEMVVYKNRLVKAMEEDEVFMNPELTLAQLAELVHTNTHTLSRVINEGFGKSFYDFINTYRVEAFTEYMLKPDNQQETFLSVALKVGFNSKTTFNRAFKKVTGTTPRAYLKERSEESAPVKA